MTRFLTCGRYKTLERVLSLRRNVFLRNTEIFKNNKLEDIKANAPSLFTKCSTDISMRIESLNDNLDLSDGLLVCPKN